MNNEKSSDSVYSGTDRIVDDGRDQVNKYGDRGREKLSEYAEQGSEKLSEMADRGMQYLNSANSVLSHFIREEPVLAIAGAFGIGYIAARILKKVSSR